MVHFRFHLGALKSLNFLSYRDYDAISCSRVESHTVLEKEGNEVSQRNFEELQCIHSLWKPLLKHTQVLNVEKCTGISEECETYVHFRVLRIHQVHKIIVVEFLFQRI